MEEWKGRKEGGVEEENVTRICARGRGERVEGTEEEWKCGGGECDVRVGGRERGGRVEETEGGREVLRRKM